MSEDDNSWMIFGGLIFAILLILCVWWFLPSRPLAGTGWQKVSFLRVIPLRPDFAPADAERVAQESGFVRLTNAAFNALIPAQDQSANFINTAVFAYSTPNTNDTRLLAIPLRGTNCYLFIQQTGEIRTVRKLHREVEAFTRKLQAPVSPHP